MDKSFLLRRREILERQGVIFKLKTDIDGGMLNDLINSNDAVFLGMSAQNFRRLFLGGMEQIEKRSRSLFA